MHRALPSLAASEAARVPTARARVATPWRAGNAETMRLRAVLVAVLAPQWVASSGCAFDSTGVATEGDAATTDPATSTTVTTADPPTSTTVGATVADADGTSTVDPTTSGPPDETTSSGPPDPTDTDDPTTESTGDATTSTGDPPVDTDCNGAPLPSLQDGAGPFTEIEIDDARFDVTQTNIAFVDPGETIALSFDYSVASCDCTGCITQGMMGLVGGDWRECFYDGLPACNAALGSATMQVEAPQEPGFYPISFWRTWRYECEYDQGGPGPDAIAGICVRDR